MKQHFSESDLQAYLDESLMPTEMAAIESAIRNDPRLLQQLSMLNRRRDAGLHSLGELWRRERLTCPTRDQLRELFTGAPATAATSYAKFHLETVGCRYCLANFEDLQRQQQEAPASASSRRSRFFQTSAKHLRGQS